MADRVDNRHKELDTERSIGSIIKSVQEGSLLRGAALLLLRGAQPTRRGTQITTVAHSTLCVFTRALPNDLNRCHLFKKIK